MSALYELLNWPVAQRLGWVAASFLWQGTAVAALLAVARFALRRASANARYLAACAALAVMAACPLATWIWMAANSPLGIDRDSMMNPSLTVAAIQAQPASSDDSVGYVNDESQVPGHPAATSGVLEGPGQTV